MSFLVEKPTLSPQLAKPGPAANTTNDGAMQKAKEFEAIFIAQMLKYSSFSDALVRESGFGGDAYSGLLTQRYAEQIVEGGGFGLAEKIYYQLTKNGAASS